MKINSYIQGMDQLKFNKPYLIITSSLKDGMCLKKFRYPVEFISPDSEGSVIREEVIRNLKTKYKGIACMFDNDTAGNKAMEKYKELYDIPSLLLPMEKDLLHGLHLRTLTEELKNTIHIEVLNLIDEIQELND